MSIIIARQGKAGVRVEESPPADEAYLQRFIADNPNTLPLDRIKDDARLVVICREFPTSSGPIDVFAVDRDGDLYVIETKLYKNPDKRRVVAQILDYGASLWKSYGDPGAFIADIDDVVRDATGMPFRDHLAKAFALSEDQVVNVVERMKRNLRDGAINFLVLMDKLHEDLRNLILFINAKSTFDILAVEMEFYRHDGAEIIIPRLFGAEVKKEVLKGVEPRYAWDQDRFLDVVKRSLAPDQAEASKRLCELSLSHGQFEWKNADFQGTQGKANFLLRGPKKPIYVLYTSGYLELKLEANDTPKGSAPERKRFAAALRQAGIARPLTVDNGGSIELEAGEWTPHVSEIVNAMKHAAERV